MMHPDKLNIRPGTISDIELISSIIRKANTPVAIKHNLTKENSPKHPSNCTPEWIKNAIENEEIFFILEENHIGIGCIAYQSPNKETAYLNRLAVLPEYQNKGLGKALVDFHINYCKKKNHSLISIGIINSNTKLKKWYSSLGFKESGLKQFEHLPFTVCFMVFKI